MRDSLNKNPKVQAGVIAALLVAGVLLFMKMSSSSGGGEAAAPAPATAAGATGSAGTGAGVESPGGTTAAATPTSTAAPTGAVTPMAASSVPAASGTVTPEALVPGPGLPAPVVQAFARGQAVVLLIVKQGATDDELVRDSVRGISKPGVAVFVAPASKIARYSRITQAAGVSRVPALIVIRPRGVGGDTPQAILSYGFRTSQSVVQAVDDALYRGRDDLPYHPG